VRCITVTVVAVVLASLLIRATHVRARIVGREAREVLVVAPLKGTPFLGIGCRQGVNLVCNITEFCKLPTWLMLSSCIEHRLFSSNLEHIVDHVGSFFQTSLSHLSGLYVDQMLQLAWELAPLQWRFTVLRSTNEADA
jgi:hypothetical protein